MAQPLCEGQQGMLGAAVGSVARQRLEDLLTVGAETTLKSAREVRRNPQTGDFIGLGLSSR